MPMEIEIIPLYRDSPAMARILREQRRERRRAARRALAVVDVVEVADRQE